eukprot:Em0199g7a
MELVSIRNINNIAVSFTTGSSTSTSGRGKKRTAKNTAEVSKSRKTTRRDDQLHVTFKKVFRHPECMVSLLSSIYEEDFTTVQYLSESPNGSGKGSIVLDLHCQTQDGKHYIVEVQYSSMNGFGERAQLYSAVLLSTQWEGTIAKANVKMPMYNKYTKLQPVRILAFVNFPLDFFKKNEQHGPIHRYKLIHEKSLTNDLKLQDYTFVDLHAMRQLSRAELYQYKINEQEQADLHSCIIAGRTDLLDLLDEKDHLLDEKDHENQALKEQIQALQKELTQSRSSSTDLHH